MRRLEGASFLLEAYATAFPDFHIAIEDLIAGRRRSGRAMDVHWHERWSACRHPCKWEAGECAERHRDLPAG
jgi:hypothetical protein